MPRTPATQPLLAAHFSSCSPRAVTHAPRPVRRALLQRATGLAWLGLHACARGFCPRNAFPPLLSQSGPCAPGTCPSCLKASLVPMACVCAPLCCCPSRSLSRGGAAASMHLVPPLCLYSPSPLLCRPHPGPQRFCDAPVLCCYVLHAGPCLRGRCLRRLLAPSALPSACLPSSLPPCVCASPTRQHVSYRQTGSSFCRSQGKRRHLTSSLSV